MIIILSPAKTIGKTGINQIPDPTLPSFINITESIVERLKQFSVDNLCELMSISKPLALLNFERYAKWQKQFNLSNSYPALLSFKGDVYEGINASDFSSDDLLFAQNHLRILSGLYGVLRPLDLMQPYRLEMSTKINVNSKSNLYEVWQNVLTEHFNSLLASDKQNTMVNLASNEYSKVIIRNKFKARVITPVFKEQKGKSYTTIAIYAKRARGLMTRFAIKNRTDDVEHLKLFNYEGYYYNQDLSKKDEWVFIR